MRVALIAALFLLSSCGDKPKCLQEGETGKIVSVKTEVVEFNTRLEPGVNTWRSIKIARTIDNSVCTTTIHNINLLVEQDDIVRGPL